MAYPTTGLWTQYGVGLPLTIATGGTASAIGNRENLMDPIVILDPTDTPVLNMLPKEDISAPYAEWLTDTLPTTSTGGALPGADFQASATTYSQRSRYTNITQLMRIDFNVNRQAIQMSQRGITAGVRNEYQYQLFRFMKGLMRNTDARIVAVSSASANTCLSATGAADSASAGVVPLTQTLRGWASAMPAVNVSGLFSTAKFASLHQTMDNAGADPDTLFVTSGTKADISYSILNTGTALATMGSAAQPGPFRRFTSDAYDKEISSIIDVIEDDFGRVMIIRDRWMPSGTSTFTATAATSVGATGGANSPAYFLLDRSKIKLSFFQRPDHFPLPPNGDSQRGFVLTEFLIKLLHPSSVGLGWNCISTQ